MQFLIKYFINNKQISIKIYHFPIIVLGTNMHLQIFYSEKDLMISFNFLLDRIIIDIGMILQTIKKEYWKFLQISDKTLLEFIQQKNIWVEE